MEQVDPEEEATGQWRRNRNRLAAARCRQKRLDQIETLQVEVSNWEQRNRTLEEEVAALRAEKEELQYILDAHRSTCSLQVKAEQVELEPLQLSQGKEELIIKPEPRQRPGSLSLTPVTVKNIEGVSIDTPSNAILSFNTLLEGRTGLTPTNILTPTSLWTPIKTSSNLNTPNCSAQQRSSVTDTNQHPDPHQPLDSNQDQLQPQHSQLFSPAEEQCDCPTESLHPGPPHLPLELTV